MKVLCCLWLTCSLCVAVAFSSGAQSFIPAPVKTVYSGKKGYSFKAQEKIFLSDPALQNESGELQQILKHHLGINAIIVPENGKGKNICLLLDKTIKDAEGYRLSVSTQGISITAQTPAGIFYGIQTLAQLLTGENIGTTEISLPSIEIEDSPRYGYRALMLDPARHFLPIRDVKRYIDLMAHYKFNVLQLHLTDDQGWRIEIKKYPQLTSVGAFRDKHSGAQGPHNGYYTQNQLKDLITYATTKHVEIVPELDIPGHTVAAIQAYPELGCAHMDSVPIIFGKTTDRTLCAAKENVYAFYANVLQEVCSLFPSRRIHLGGDEAVIEKNWGHCPDCQALMQAQGYHHVREVMGYFFGRIHQIVRNNGKELMLWCELDNVRMPANEFLFPYPKDCTLFSWRMGLTPKTIELTGKAGIKLIASPGEHCYFDYPQYKGDLPEFNNWGMPILTLQQAYEWDPGYDLSQEQQQHIIGVAGLLWSEAIQDINRVTYMTYPRALALAEAGWSLPQNRNWENFKKNLFPHLTELMRQGVSFRVPFEIYRDRRTD